MKASLSLCTDKETKPTKRAEGEARLCHSEAGGLLLYFAIKTEEGKRYMEDEMKLKVTLKRYISNPDFNRLKGKVRKSNMVMSPELQPRYSNGQFNALSSTFSEKA